MNIQETYNAILAHIAKDPPAKKETRAVCGNGLLSMHGPGGLTNAKLPWSCWQTLNLGRPGVICTAEEMDLGRIGKLARDLHDKCFPGYVRLSLVSADRLNDSNSVAHHVPLEFSAAKYQRFAEIMQRRGRRVDLRKLPPCPQAKPDEFEAFFKQAQDSTLAVSYTQPAVPGTGGPTNSIAMYKSFRFNGANSDNIALAGCTWTLTWPNAGFPSVVMEVARFDPLAYFFADRADAFREYSKLA